MAITIKSPRAGCAGFSLTEVMMSLAVVAIIAGLSIPPFTTLMLNTSAKTAALDIYGTTVFARSEAIKRNADIDIIPVAGNWKNGWTVQVGATVLRTVAPLKASIDDMTVPVSVTYRYDGRLATPGTVTYVLRVTSNADVTPRRVIVDSSGRPSIRKGLL